METEFFFDGIIDVLQRPPVIVEDRDREHAPHTRGLGDAMMLRAIADIICCDADAVELTPLLT